MSGCNDEHLIELLTRLYRKRNHLHVDDDDPKRSRVEITGILRRDTRVADQLDLTVLRALFNELC